VADDPAYFSNRAVAWRNLNDNDHALADYKAALQLKPNYLPALLGRGRVYEDMKLYSDALADFEEAVRLHPDDASAQNSACWARAAFLNAGFDQASKECDKAVELAPKDANHLGSRAMLAMKQKRYQDAWTDYDAAVKLDPKSASHWYGRAMAALRMGKAADARADLEKAKAIDPKIAETYASYGITP